MEWNILSWIKHCWMTHKKYLEICVGGSFILDLLWHGPWCKPHTSPNYVMLLDSGSSSDV